MAENTQNKPPRTAADKDKSRQQSRTISGRQAARSTTSSQPGRAQNQAKGASGATKSQPAKKGGPNKGGTAPKNRPAAPPRRSSATLLTWGTVGLVLVIVLALVIVKVTGSSPTNTVTASTAVPASIVQAVTHVPASVFDKVGVSSPDVPVSPPTEVKGQTPYVVDGKTTVLYYGAEYCPYCAAERWAIIAALSRFGTFKNLETMQSSSTDVFPSTQTFTFIHASYSSPYVTLETIEHQSNIPSATTGYTILQNGTKAEQKLVAKYDSSTYFPSVTAGSVSYPFIDFGNRFLVAGASYSPSILQNLSRAQIAQSLSDSSNPVAQAIDSLANYFTAAICSDGTNMPAGVCSSKGVLAASKALGITT
jgi:hypothetical protein